MKAITTIPGDVITIRPKVRIRVKIERFVISDNPEVYNREVDREALLETCAEPTDENIKMIQSQVTACLNGYKPSEAV